MMMATIIAMMMQPTAPIQDSDEETLHRSKISIPIPQEIARALFPYMICVSSATNAELADGGVSSSDAFRALHQRAVDSCNGVRIEAKRNAIAMLSKSTIAAAQRDEFVENALLKIDQPPEAVIAQLDEGRAAAATEDQ